MWLGFPAFLSCFPRVGFFRLGATDKMAECVKKSLKGPGKSQKEFARI